MIIFKKASLPIFLLCFAFILVGARCPNNAPQEQNDDNTAVHPRLGNATSQKDQGKAVTEPSKRLPQTPYLKVAFLEKEISNGFYPSEPLTVPNGLSGIRFSAGVTHYRLATPDSPWLPLPTSLKELKNQTIQLGSRNPEASQHPTRIFTHWLDYQPHIVSREVWKAREPKKALDVRGGIQNILIAHTVSSETTPCNETTVQSIQNLHMDAFGFDDMGCHLIVGREGKIWRGRADNCKAALRPCVNASTLGIYVWGCYCDRRDQQDDIPLEECDKVVSPSMLETLAQIIARVALEWDFEINRETVKGHRELEGRPTVSPGSLVIDALERLVERANGIRAELEAQPLEVDFF